MKRPPSEAWAGTKNRDGDRIPSMEQMRNDPTLFKSAQQQLREERGTSRRGVTTYRLCKKHKKWMKDTHKCFRVEQEAPSVNAPAVRVFQSYWDPHLGGKLYGGHPVYVRSARQKRELLKANGLVEVG